MSLEKDIENTKESDLEILSELAKKLQTQMETYTIEQKEKIGNAYLRYSIGLDEEMLYELKQGNEKTEKTLGVRQTRTDPITQNSDLFWRTVCNINPCIYSEEEKSWLGKNVKSPKELHTIIMMLGEQSTALAISAGYEISPSIMKIYEATQKYR